MYSNKFALKISAIHLSAFLKTLSTFTLVVISNFGLEKSLVLGTIDGKSTPQPHKNALQWRCSNQQYW